MNPLEPNAFEILLLLLGIAFLVLVVWALVKYIASRPKRAASIEPAALAEDPGDESTPDRSA
ncbi:hypothetical protein [Zhihengliuella halotolerans]|uniref:hypothetical protein n=1 Tax=Zhihengliuella halotolerans TaxID=370736 RepID=UPI000C7FA920|nr:hypothetical protein [Zhihengliuella halotolerans]